MSPAAKPESSRYRASAELDKAVERHQVTQGRVLVSEWIKLRSLRSTVYTLLAAIVMTVGAGWLLSAFMASQSAQPDSPHQVQFDPTGASLRGVFLAQIASACSASTTHRTPRWPYSIPT